MRPPSCTETLGGVSVAFHPRFGWSHLTSSAWVSWVLAEDLKLRGAIIRDKELIMLPNEQATRWEDGEGGRSEWLWQPAVRN